jgi:hypothetical protein
VPGVNAVFFLRNLEILVEKKSKKINPTIQIINPGSISFLV